VKASARSPQRTAPWPQEGTRTPFEKPWSRLLQLNSEKRDVHTLGTNVRVVHTVGAKFQFVYVFEMKLRIISWVWHCVSCYFCQDGVFQSMCNFFVTPISFKRPALQWFYAKAFTCFPHHAIPQFTFTIQSTLTKCISTTI